MRELKSLELQVNTGDGATDWCLMPSSSFAFPCCHVYLLIPQWTLISEKRNYETVSHVSDNRHSLKFPGKLFFNFALQIAVNIMSNISGWVGVYLPFQDLYQGLQLEVKKKRKVVSPV